MNTIDQKMKMIKFLAEFKSLCEKNKGFSAGELCNIHNVGRSIPTVMQNMNLITKVRYGLWTWNYEGEINIDFVLRINDGVKSYQLECTKRKKSLQLSMPLSDNKTLERIELKIDKILKALAIL